MTESREIRLDELLIAGTDDDVAELYRQLPRRAAELAFGLVEDEVIVLDTETTGLRPTECSLLEISAIRLVGSTTLGEFHSFVDPGQPIPPEITELTGITQEDVTGAPSPSEAVAELARFAEDRNIIAHNADFDRSFIMRQAQPGDFGGDWVDTLALSQIVLPRLKSHRLVDLARAFGLHTPSHRASDDTRCLAELWRILLAGVQAMPAGLAGHIAGLSPGVDWPLRPYFAQAAQEHPGVDFSLRRNRSERTRASVLPPRQDAELLELAFASPEEIAGAFGPDGIVSGMYPNYEERSEQVAMAGEVAASLREGDLRIIEAGTGVGKSMAYLVPLALGARRNNITMGIATKTNALMDQLVYHELPRLKRALGDLSYVPLKGYDHYPCLRKLESFARADHDDCAIVNMIATLLSYATQTSHGDFDALGIAWSRLPRMEVQANPRDCLKKRCPFFPNLCFLHGARRAAAGADLVITNHALLFRDMQADNGILPPVRHWVVDEAHSVEGEARRQLSCSLDSRDLETALNRLVNPRSGVIARIQRQADTLEGGDILYGACADIIGRVERMRLPIAEFLELLDAFPQAGTSTRDNRRVRQEGSYAVDTIWISEEVRQSQAWDEIRERGEGLAQELGGLNGRIADLISMLEQFEGSVAGQLAELAGISSDIRTGTDSLKLVLDGSDDEYVYSLRVDHGPFRGSRVLEAQRLDIGGSLANELYPQSRSIVFTSATISTAGDKPFSHFMNAAGLDRVSDRPVIASEFRSSYDFDRAMTILLPSDVPEPNAPDYHDAFARLLYETHVAMGGSVLTLFTNRREMEAFYHELKPRLAEEGIDLVAQTRGTSTKNLRDRFLSDSSLSLFALKSFWEGFDAPGDTLRCVIIARLPFGRPDDPLAREREAREGRAAWRAHSLPEAIIELKQAAGRLIRHSTDRGWLVLADARLQTKGYGKSFLRAMPTSDIRVRETSEIAWLMETQEPGID